MNRMSTALAGVALIGSWSASALAETPNTEQPMLNHVGKAVMQPAKDVNLAKDKIPVRLAEIRKAPYDLTGIEGCRALTAEITGLRPLLGPDVNENPKLSRAEKRERKASRLAGGFIGGLIPFRSVVREVTGANASRRRYQAALAAGFARRSFLKGISMGQGCQDQTEAQFSLTDVPAQAKLRPSEQPGH